LILIGISLLEISLIPSEERLILYIDEHVDCFKQFVITLAICLFSVYVYIVVVIIVAIVIRNQLLLLILIMIRKPYCRLPLCQLLQILGNKFNTQFKILINQVELLYLIKCKC